MSLIDVALLFLDGVLVFPNKADILKLEYLYIVPSECFLGDSCLNLRCIEWSMPKAPKNT